MEVDEHYDMKKLVLRVGQNLMDIYWSKLYQKIKEDRSLLKYFTAFLIHPEKLIYYLGKNHLAIEYLGAERMDELSDEGFTLETQFYDYSDSENLLEKVIGFDYDDTINIELPLPPFSEELIIPTNRGIDKLVELKWNFAAQSYIITFNSSPPVPQIGHFARITNSFFFDADESGLKTRHIKWIDFIPIKIIESGEYLDISFTLEPYKKLVENDLDYVYPIPEGFDYVRLERLNRFIEFIGDKKHSEPDITTFLSKEENQFILSMYFSAKEIFPQKLCKWQSEEKEDIKPDFFVLRPNGFADIVEFKLPYIKNNAIVGKPNRETFASEINSYISQTRNYKYYFEDPNNRKWFKEQYNFDVVKPRRFLVVCRRADFSSDNWKEIISDYNDIEIITYDDLVDGVTAQFYTV